MPKLRDRAARLIAALSLAALVSFQIPMSGTVALAQNDYDDDDNNGVRNVVIGAMVLLAGYGIYTAVTDKGE